MLGTGLGNIEGCFVLEILGLGEGDLVDGLKTLGWEVTTSGAIVSTVSSKRFTCR